VVAACILRADGRAFAEYSRNGAAASCPAPVSLDGVRFEGGELIVSRAILLDNRRIGSLVLRYDLDEIEERIKLYGAATGMILLGSVLVALLLSARLQRVIAAPIAELARTTEAVSGSQDYGIRAQKRSGDELGVLVEAFNSMLAGIQSRDHDLKQALLAREAALREAQSARDFLSTTLASIGDAVVATDAEGRVVFANAVASRLMGHPEPDIVGRPLDDVMRLMDEQTRSFVESPARVALRQGPAANTAKHLLLVARDGIELPVDDSAAPIRDHQGNLVGAVLIFRDITERRRAEQELHAAREQLQLVTDTMAPAVTHCSRDLRYIWASRRYAEWLHTTPEEIAGRPIREILGNSAFAAIRPYIDRVLAGERVDYQAQLDLPHIGRRWIRAVYVPSYDPGGAITGWVADVSDITDLREAQAEVARINADLRKSNESLARSNEDLGRFAYAASHDLQEPLRMVTTYVQLLARSLPPQLDGEPKVFIQNVLDGSMRMRGLLADLLSYSEIGGEPIEPIGPVDLNSVLCTVLQNLEVAIQESGASIESERLPVVSGYAGHFVQLFQNLVGNAIKYRADNAPRIRITCRDEGREFQFAVTDNGIGIDPEYHGKIFGVFKRLHGKKIPGTGIGLAICQRVVERYGGRIRVESQVGKGATFFFTLSSDASESKGVTNEHNGNAGA
jgi:PAS domain S-box-containing protein